MATYKLTYFNARGGAEPIRFIFAQAGVEYEDVRMSWGGDEWTKLKPTTPTGFLPILDVDGVTLFGGLPIARFLAERFGLGGKGDVENAKLGGILDYVHDSIQKLVPFFHKSDEQEKREFVEGARKDIVPKYWTTIDKWIADNGSSEGWVYGLNPTYVDFSIYCSFDIVEKIEPALLTNYPNVAKLKASVELLPNIAKWIKERPQTEH